MIFIIDFWLINLAFYLTRLWGFSGQLSSVTSTSFFLIFSLIWIIAGFLYKIYRVDSFSLMQSISVNLFNAFVLHISLIIILLFFFPAYQVGLETLVSIYLCSATLIVATRIIYKLVQKYFEFYGYDKRKVVIIGITKSGKTLHSFFDAHNTSGYHFNGFFDDHPDEAPEHKHLVVGGLDSIKSYCINKNIDEIYFALPLSNVFNEKLVQEISKFADDNFIYFRIAPDFSGVVQDNYNVFMIDTLPILTPRKEPLEISLNAYLKRSFDIAFSAGVILFLFPIIVPLIALAIRLDSEGPIFFKQLRPGKKNKLFECYKFRTMRTNGTPEMQAKKGDARITRVGRFLRHYSLDELPQFFNVLLGNMSVVGPRPNMISQLEEYSKTIEQYKIRHFITPGITGYAQVNGFRGETEHSELMKKRVEYDVLYIENWSLSLDVKIILLTIWNMFKGEKNAY
jgi:putative colanic acid biosynthesis UDP-glucose lipid carrier transferase